MTQEQDVPRDFWEKVRKIAAEEAAKSYRSGALRNSSMTSGDLSVKGGAVRVYYPDVYGGGNAVYFGDTVSGGNYSGTGMLMEGPDGTDIASFTWNFETGSSTAHIHDEQNNIIFSNDSASKQGIARPYVPFVFYRSRSNDWPTVSNTTFETVYRARGPKQHPKLFVETWLHATAAGAVAEIQVLVNGSVWGAAQQSNGAFVTGLNFGPLAVDGSHMSTLAIEVQARIVSGGGTAEVGVGRIEGQQS